LTSKIKALIGGDLIDGTGKEPLKKAVLLIENEKITALGEKGEVDIPNGAKIIDVNGKTIIPGLIDAHLHFSGSRPGDGRLGRMTIGEPCRAIRAAVDAYSLLKMGYTGARDCGGTIGIWLKKAIDEGTVPGPRIMASGLCINNTFGHIGSNPLPLKIANAMGRTFADGVPQCLEAVRTRLREGADFIKIASGLKGESRKFPKCMPSYSFEEIKAMADEAHRAFTIIASHCQGTEGIITSLKAGVDTIEHGTEFDEECSKLAVKLNRIYVPTLAISIKRPGYALKDANDELREEMNRKLYESVRIAHEHGVKVASASDFSGGDTLGALPMGKNALDLERLVTAGLSPMDAIVSATKIASETMMMEELIGTLEPGKYADLVVVNGDPIQNISILQEEKNIGLVIKGGEIVVKR
jgi:imidazolonepropionase-like amidohydrolase